MNVEEWHHVQAPVAVVEPERRGEHGCGKVFRVVAGLLRCLAVAVVLGEVAVLLGVGGPRQADRRRDEAVRLVRVLPRHHAVDDLSRHDQLLAFLAADLPAVRRENRADCHEVRLLDAGITQRELERRETVLVHADTVREEDGLRHEHFAHARVAALAELDAAFLLLFSHLLNGSERASIDRAPGWTDRKSAWRSVTSSRQASWQRRPSSAPSPSSRLQALHPRPRASRPTFRDRRGAGPGSPRGGSCSPRPSCASRPRGSRR